MSHSTDAKGMFTVIYNKGWWGQSNEPGDKYYSGWGSHSDEFVGGYVSAATAFLMSLSNRPAVVDLGCGDFAVGSRIRPYCGRYIAVDVVDGLIARNKERYSKEDVEFRVVDIIEEDLPEGDVVFLREVLQHLSNNDIQKIVAKLRASYRFVIVTENLPLAEGFTANLDKPRGHDIRLHIGEEGSGVILTEAPFCLQVKQNQVLYEVFQRVLGRKAVIRTNLYELQ